MEEWLPTPASGFSAGSASTLTASLSAAASARFASCAGPASTGVSDAPTSRARLVQPYAHSALRAAGYAAPMARAVTITPKGQRVFRDEFHALLGYFPAPS